MRAFRQAIFTGVMACAIATLACAAGASDDVVILTDRTGDTRLTGVLLGFEDGIYRFRTDFGEISVSGDMFECSGSGCPKSVPQGLQIPDPATARRVVQAMEDLGARDGWQVSGAEGPTILQSPTGQVVAQVDVFAGTLVLSLPAVAPEGWQAAPTADGVVVVVNKQAPLSRIDADQVPALAAGEISDWADIGAAPGPLRVVWSESALPEQGGLLPRPAGEASDVIAVVSADPSALGLIRAREVVSAEGADVRTLDLQLSCGLIVAPSLVNLRSDIYPFSFMTLPTDIPDADGAADVVLLARAIGQLPVGHLAGALAERQPVAAQGNFLASVVSDLRGSDELVTLADMLTDLQGAELIGPTIPFRSNGAAPDAVGLAELAPVIAHLKTRDWSRNQLVLNGFSDEFESGSLRTGLSRARAEAIRNQIQEAMPDAELTIRTAGYEGLAPRGCNTNGTGRARNRRVEIWIKPLP